MNKIKFDDITVFEKLEDEAIDGQLNYENFPPEEYKYFSKLSKLGYNNRHKGWSVEICEAKQDEFRTQYSEEKAHSNRFVAAFKRINDDLIKTHFLITKMYKSNDVYEILDTAFQTIEKLTNENGFTDRMRKRVEKLSVNEVNTL